MPYLTLPGVDLYSHNRVGADLGGPPMFSHISHPTRLKPLRSRCHLPWAVTCYYGMTSSPPPKGN